MKTRGRWGGGVSEPVFFPDAIPKDVQVFKDPHWVRTAILLRDPAKERLAKLIADAQVDGYDDFRVEHFFPKKPQIPPTPINYALHWPNLLAVCHGGSRSWLASHIKDRHTSPDHCCDVPKGGSNWLGIILDPQTISAFPALFSFIEQGAQAGQISVADTCPFELKEQAANSIEKLRLNAKRLRSRRKPVIDALRENVAVLLAQGYELEAAMQELAQSQLRKNTSQCWPKYFSCIRWYLGSYAEEQLHCIDYQG